MGQSPGLYRAWYRRLRRDRGQGALVHCQGPFGRMSRLYGVTGKLGVYGHWVREELVPAAGAQEPESQCVFQGTSWDFSAPDEHSWRSL